MNYLGEPLQVPVSTRHLVPESSCDLGSDIGFPGSVCEVPIPDYMLGFLSWNSPEGSLSTGSCKVWVVAPPAESVNLWLTSFRGWSSFTVLNPGPRDISSRVPLCPLGPHLILFLFSEAEGTVLWRSESEKSCGELHTTSAIPENPVPSLVQQRSQVHIKVKLKIWTWFSIQFMCPLQSHSDFWCSVGCKVKTL